MSRPVVITVAITGSVPRKKDNPALPVTPSEQIESTHEAFEAGATIVHIHVRNPDESSSSDPKLFQQVQEGINKHCPGMIVQFSTGGRSGKGNERGGMLPLRPDMASLATGSCNFPNIIYENPPSLVDATWTHGSTDGEIFHVIANGTPQKTAMLGFKGKMPDQDMWHIVNYLRSLGPKTATR